MADKRKNRDSGIELLRILAAMGVVLLHYNDGRAFEYAEPNSLNMYLLYFLESLCICSVDLFLLISGYFLASSDKRNYIKPVELIIQTSVFNIVFYGWDILQGATTLSISGVLLTIVPANYFVILYSCLYMISPYLNKVFRGFDEKQWKRFMITSLLLFAVYPTLIDLFKEMTGRAWEGLSSISRIGNIGGFNIVNFCLLYFIGAYLRYNRIPEFIRKHLLWLIFIVTALIYMWALFNSTMELKELCSAWCYHNPLVILMAVLLFLAFKDLKFRSRLINEIAGAAFTCFLFQWYMLRIVNIQKYVEGDTIHMIFHIVYTVVMAYTTSYIAYKIWGCLTNWIFRKFERHTVKGF